MTADIRVGGVSRACAADRRIDALDQVVTALALHTAETMCADCVWNRMVKPLARPLLGYKRGYPPPPAKDPGGRTDFGTAHRRPAVTDTERWLRSERAWFEITNDWVRRLHSGPEVPCEIPAHALKRESRRVGR